MPVFHIFLLPFFFFFYNFQPLLYPHHCAFSALFLVIKNTVFLLQFLSPSSIKIQRSTSLPYFALSLSSKLFRYVFTFYVCILHQLFPQHFCYAFNTGTFWQIKKICHTTWRLGHQHDSMLVLQSKHNISYTTYPHT
jgi:hypothetical protein